jgi:hypothetical protein
MEIYLTFEELVVDEYVQDAHPPVGALLDERDSLLTALVSLVWRSVHYRRKRRVRCSRPSCSLSGQ